MARDAEIEFEREREVRAVTSPGFVLSLASGAASSYRLLYKLWHQCGGRVSPPFITYPSPSRSRILHQIFACAGVWSSLEGTQNPYAIKAV